MKIHTLSLIGWTTSNFFLVSFMPSMATSISNKVDPPVTPICRGPQLTLERVGDDAGAGQQALILSLLNNSSIPCHLTGYPVVSFIGTNNQPINLSAVDATQTPFMETEAPQPVVLHRGEQASFEISYSVVPSGDQNSCATARTLEVSPPGDIHKLSLPISTQICGSEFKITPIQAQEIHS